MFSKDADAAVWDNLKDLRTPIYNGRPLNLDGFLKRLEVLGMTITEDMDPAAAEKYVFKRS